MTRSPSLNAHDVNGHLGPASLRLLVRSMTWESDGVLSLVLVDPEGKELPPWDPGAHLDLRLPSGLVRQYSLCGDPADENRWRIGVLREEVSRGGSSWIHSELRPGDVIDVVGPRNSFALEDGPRYLFIAGGIGITPLLPMITAVDAREADWELVYGGRRRASMAFVDELSVHGERVTLWPQDERGLIDLTSLLEPRTDTLVYCCGPEPLLAAVEDRFGAWPANALHVERFAPRPTASELPAGAFEVELARTGTTIAVPPELSIIEALEREGVYPDSSCLEGICGTCATTVLEGEPDHRDSILTTTERESGETMYICVSRAKGRRLVLDL